MTHKALIASVGGKEPKVDPEAFAAPTSVVLGDVTLHAGASVWYGAVLRADICRIVVRDGANVQDNSVIHVGEGSCEVGPGATVGHLCVVHHCTIGAEALIGNGAAVLDGAVVGARAMVAAGATVGPGTAVPAATVAFGTPAKRFVPLTDGARQWVDANPAIYQDLARRHRNGVSPAD
jgi:carbonic anhydrase/acetyltransferase-like protein (isoleucine patch superfamily)